MPVSFQGKLFYPSHHSISPYCWPFSFGLLSALHGRTISTTVYQHKILAQCCFTNKVWFPYPLTYLLSSQNTCPFWTNVKLFYCLQRHSHTINILWHSPFAVWTYGSDKLSKYCCQQTESGSIIECLYITCSSKLSMTIYYPTLYPYEHPDSISHNGIFSTRACWCQNTDGCLD